MPTIKNDENEPRLEWCAECDRPKQLCEGHRRPDTVPVDTAGDHDRTRPTEATGHRPDTSTEVDRTPTGHGTAAAVDADRTIRPDRLDIRQRMAPAPSQRSRLQRAIDWTAEWGMLLPIWLLAGLLGAAGFAVSFFTVEKKMQPYFGELAWLVPAGTDLGIVVFTLLDILLARRGMRISWLRYVPWSLAAATIYLNVTSYSALEAQVAHAVLPALWIVFSEAVAKIMKRKARAEATQTAEIPAVRWLCAPVATLILWRAMRLWDIATYSQALELEENRQLAKAVMRDQFGGLRHAPRTLRVRYRQRKITVEEVYQAAFDAAKVGAAPAVSSPRPVKPVRSNGRPSTPARPGAARDTKPVRSTAANPTSGQHPRGASTRRTGQASKSAALSKAWADFQSEGVADPTVRQLADRAGCSTGLAGEFKKKLRSGPDGTAAASKETA